MGLKQFYTALLSILATVIALSLLWEFLLETRLLLLINPDFEEESTGERWEFVVTTAVFSFLALTGPAVIGTRMIRRAQALHGEVTRLSQQDSLTGLFNRRKMTELLESEIQRATRYGKVFSIILLDIDHFKSVNDQLGHQAGDEVLTTIANEIRSRARATDLVGRWGGEEFLIISPETTIDGAAALAETIRCQLDAIKLDGIGTRTASFGVTDFTAGDNGATLVSRADAALYRAKKGGRNRVEKSPSPAAGRVSDVPA